MSFMRAKRTTIMRHAGVGEPALLGPEKHCITLILILGSFLTATPVHAEWRVHPDGPLGANSIAEDDQGNLWFDSFRYDGLTWEQVVIPLGDGDPNVNRVRKVITDRGGGLWFGTWGGVVHYARGAWTLFTSGDGLGSNSINDLLEDQSGVVWAATGKGLSRFNGDGSWTNFAGGLPLTIGTNLAQILESRSGDLWVRTGLGVSHFDGRNHHPTQLPGFTVTMAEDGNGRLWVGQQRVGATPGGVWRLDFGWAQFRSLDGHTINDVYSIVTDKSGGVWLGTDIGAAREEDGIWTVFSTEDGLPGNIVYKVFCDSRNQVWAITNPGTAWYDGRQWREAAAKIGSGSVVNQFVGEDRRGNLWFPGVSFYSFDGSSWDSYGDEEGLGELATISHPVAEDSLGDIWLATYTGAARYDGREWTKTLVPPGNPDGYVYSVAPDSNGKIWFVGGGGVSTYDGTSWWNVPPGAPPDSFPGSASFRILINGPDDVWFPYPANVHYDGHAFSESWSDPLTKPLFDDFGVVELRDMIRDPSGDYWFLGLRESGLVVHRYDGSSYQEFTVEDGVPENCFSLEVDPQGGLLFSGNPMARLDGGVWTTFPGTQGLGTYGTLATIPSRSGEIWVGGELGTSRFAGGRWVPLTTNEGAPLGIRYPAFEDSRGGMWFVGEYVVARLIPDRVPPRTVMVLRPPEVTKSSQLSAGFLAAYDDAEEIEYSYRFDEGSWSPWSPVGSWTGIDVADGDHVLEARSRDAMGNVDPFPAVARFTVDATPPAPVLSEPTFGSPVRGTATIRGSAADSRFRSYRVEARPSKTTTWTGALMLAESGVPVEEGVLASWDTGEVPDGNYDLRLSVTDSLGLVGTAISTVVVDNEAPYIDETAPVTIRSAVGGNVYTTQAETHLYFPPHAFSEDALVMVQAVDEGLVPEELPSGAVRLVSGYEVSWSGKLEKAARFTVSYGESEPASGTPAVYLSEAGGSWDRLGGTVDGEAHTLTLSVSGPGRYAVYTDDGRGPGGDVALSAITLTPRVFSPRGGYADRQVGIGFSLGSAAPVTVRVFSRSGRLIRDVVSGEYLGAGANQVLWDGLDRDGGVVVDDLYLVTVEALGRTQTKTLAVVK